jgi:hypothetical protein
MSSTQLEDAEVEETNDLKLSLPALFRISTRQVGMKGFISLALTMRIFPGENHS